MALISNTFPPDSLKLGYFKVSSLLLFLAAAWFQNSSNNL